MLKLSEFLYGEKMRIININGPINSGKTTISKLLLKALPNALFIEVDELLSDEEQEKLGLSLQQGWQERTNRLDRLVNSEKEKNNYQNIIFAYPMTENLYHSWKAWEDVATKFISITLAPRLEVCLQNRGTRQLDEWEKNRIREMYQQGYHNSPLADLIIDNSAQSPAETLQRILDFLQI